MKLLQPAWLLLIVIATLPACRPFFSASQSGKEKSPELAHQKCEEKFFHLWHENKCRPFDYFQNILPRMIKAENVELATLSYVQREYLRGYLRIQDHGYEEIFRPLQMTLISDPAEFASTPVTSISKEENLLKVHPHRSKSVDIEDQLLQQAVFCRELGSWFTGRDGARLEDFDKIREISLRAYAVVTPPVRPQLFEISGTPLTQSFVIHSSPHGVKITLDSQRITFEDMVTLLLRLKREPPVADL